MLNKQAIAELLSTNDRAVCRALVLLNERQTRDEQTSENTKYNNGRGFRPCHAFMGTRMANFFSQRGFLTAKQLAYWRRPMASGDMKLAIYWKQLAEEAEAKSMRQQEVTA